MTRVGEVATEAPRPAGISRGLIALFAITCGTTVANLYYAQPLLPSIADTFGVSEGAAGLLVTVTQIFYALGLVLVVPLGDLHDRRALVVRLLGVCALGLVGAALAPTIALLAVALAVAALTTVVVQVLVPFSSTLALPSERGRVVGTVMGGLLTGILLARTFSGLVAGFTGWRVPFALAAVAMVVLALALWRALPQVPPPSALPYRRLLASIATLIRQEPILRRRMAYGALGFASFSLVWTAIAFLLAGPPYHYSQSVIGLFGLAGAVGALGAQGVGRLADRGHGHVATGAALVAILVGWGLLGLGGESLLALLAGLVLIDFAIQAQNVLSQGFIYALGSQHASRVTTAYVTSNFIGGAIGSAIGSLAWSLDGWDGVYIAGTVFASLALLLWSTEMPREPAAAAAASQATD